MFLDRRALRARNLMMLIFGITVIPLLALLWMGWQLIEQGRDLESRRAQERIDVAANLLVRSLQLAVATSEKQLAAGYVQWPAGAVAVTIRKESIEVHPKGRVAYLPLVRPLPEASQSLFAEGEILEFQKKDLASAIGVFREMTNSADPAIRAQAVFRLGNTLASNGRISEALELYDQLRMADGVAVGGVPAGLISTWRRCQLLEQQHRTTELRVEAKRLADGLESGRWDLTYPVYNAYAPDAWRWSGIVLSGPRPSEVFGDVVESLFQRWRTLSRRGYESHALAGRNLTVLWQNEGDAFRALIATPEFVDAQWLAAAEPVVKEHQVTFRLGVMVGEGGMMARRPARQTDLPWDIAVTSASAAKNDDGVALQRRWIIAGLALLVILVLMADYVILRAFTRELAVARLQSDFVAAVSHEFRTPLTSLRQFNDMLRTNEPDTERRTLCYEAQARATDRLTKLVESLLDFGRMEAGAWHYTFETRDSSELVGRIVEEFRSSARAAGHNVEFHRNGNAAIEADSDALGRAVWNLLENAVKYSPDDHTVEVELHRDNGNVRIDVCDHGIGIPAHERRLLFKKFQRGEQARTRGIKGTGIGLTMVDEIVRAHKGRVEVRSEPGKGSVFTIVLPAQDGDKN